MKIQICISAIYIIPTKIILKSDRYNLNINGINSGNVIKTQIPKIPPIPKNMNINNHVSKTKSNWPVLVHFLR